MATAARALARTSYRSSGPLLSSSARPVRFNPQPLRRGYASGPSSKSSNALLYTLAGTAVSAGGLYYYLTQTTSGSHVFSTVWSSGPNTKNTTLKDFKPKPEDYQKVYDAIAKRLEEHDDWDDGSYGPVLLRLAWHCSGTYDKATGTGGSNGATMRFSPEGDHGANSGLKAARDFMEPVKEAYPWITYSDLWTLGGVCALQEMQGPSIPWRPGRSDRDVSFSTPDGRLPDGSKEQSHLRSIFYRMGFNDQEIVALSGAHALGRCHTDRSGFDGPWTFSPTILTNDYYRLLINETWSWKKWAGPKQYEDKTSKSLMMLPTDMALVKDKVFKTHVERYAKDNEVFFNEFRDVIVKLLELGVPFQGSGEERLTFKPTSTA
ncbi:MAG: heme peroxidase [Vezdaea aestivalis]|nr:MAG: heme peroxidase [Vezdaea aestivalis]